MTIADDRGKVLSLARPPERIVSLVPSDTYTLLRLGAGARVVARTVYCVEPADEVAGIATVGGTKNADVAAILALGPDLVIANQEENRPIDLERLEAAGVTVLVSFPQTVAAGLAHAERLAALLEWPAVARARMEQARLAFARFARGDRAAVATFVPIWMSPLMTANGETFLSDALELAGGRNVFSDRARRYPLRADLGERAPLPPEAIAGRDTRYPRVTLAEVAARAPEIVLLPDEPHAFSEADAGVFRALDMPAAKRPGGVRFCDGKDLMWYGLRCLEGLERLAQVLSR